MKHLFLSLILMAGGLLIARPLPPTEKAPLRIHLLEVNAEWSHMAPEAAWLDAEVAFPHENARIQTHLNLVVATLRQVRLEGFAPEALAERDRLLDELQAYAQRGLFPENTHHDFRIPYFIDHKGTACAVGYLMIRSGAAAVAARVHDEINQAYVREIPYVELPAWAASHGFTQKELAWIQPGYPPPTNYAALGSGVNGAVSAVVVDPADNSLVLAGSFDDASGVSVQGIARWKNDQYEAIGSGLLGEIYTLTFHDGKLYAGGRFGSGINYNVASWDGQSWAYASASNSGAVKSLLSMDGRLFAGCENGVVAELMSGTWSQVAVPLNGPVHTMTALGGDLIIGGGFTEAEGNALPYVAKLSSNQARWDTLPGTAMDNEVFTLHNHKSTLYAGGPLFDANQARTMGFASHGANGWEMVFDTTTDLNALSMYQWINQTSTSAPSVQTLHSHQGGLFLGGEFFVAGQQIGVAGGSMGWAQDINGSFQLAPVLGFYYDTVMAMTSYQNSLIVAGDFPHGGPVGYGNIVITNLQGLPGFVGISDPLSQLDIQIGPLPWSETATVQGLPAGKLEFKLFDIQGKSIPLRYNLAGEKATLYRDGQATGLYMLHILQDGRPLGTAKVMIR